MILRRSSTDISEAFLLRLLASDLFIISEISGELLCLGTEAGLLIFALISSTLFLANSELCDVGIISYKLRLSLIKKNRISGSEKNIKVFSFLPQ